MMGLRDSFVCTGPAPGFDEESARHVVNINNATAKILEILDLLHASDAVFVSAVVSRVVQSTYAPCLGEGGMAAVLALSERAIQHFPTPKGQA